MSARLLGLLTVHVTGENKVVLQDLQTLASYHVNGKKAISHFKVLSKFSGSFVLAAFSSA